MLPLPSNGHRKAKLAAKGKTAVYRAHAATPHGHSKTLATSTTIAESVCCEKSLDQKSIGSRPRDGAKEIVAFSGSAKYVGGLLRSFV
jgi:hypothetical protein